jgi:hypothetical protein
MSLIPRSRFSIDSTRSPQVATATRATPSTTPTHHGACSPKTVMQTAATVPSTTEPAKPSHDFFGLIRGAIGCLPNSTPAM